MRKQGSNNIFREQREKQLKEEIAFSWMTIKDL